MTKTKLKSVATKADFDWNPSADQTYDLDSDMELRGTASSFNKFAPYSFIMDTPERTLTLQTAQTDSGQTACGKGLEGNTSASPCIFDIRNGTFIYAGGTSNTLFLSESSADATGVGTTLTVRNNAEFTVKDTKEILTLGALELRIQDNGTIDLAGDDLIAIGILRNYGIVDLADQARMSIATKDVIFELTHVALADRAQMTIAAGDITIILADNPFEVSSSPNTSSPAGGYSLDSASVGTTFIRETRMNVRQTPVAG
jgi:hypothetical protein